MVKQRIGAPSTLKGLTQKVKRASPPAAAWKSGSFFTGNDDVVLEHFAQPFAERFLVSQIAMRIRLEMLGLLHREVPRQRVLSGL